MGQPRAGSGGSQQGGWEGQWWGVWGGHEKGSQDSLCPQRGPAPSLEIPKAASDPRLLIDPAA